MALTTGPNMGLLVNGEKGEAHYEALMRFFRGLDTLVQPRVSSMVGTLPTTGLTDGLTVVYTGNDSNKNRIARYSTVLAGWEYFVPRSGWEIAVVDQIDENGQFKKYQYTGSDWVEKLTAGGLTLAAGDARYERLIKHNLTATTDPTVTDDSTQGYSVLSRWVNTTTKEAFLALDVAPGVANWQKSTLTVDELGTAALAMVGVLDNQLPTVSTVKNLLATLAVFGAGSAASAGTKGLVPAPPQSEVLRFLRSDGVWAFFEIPEGTELSKGANIGEGTGTHGIYLQTVGDTLQFKSLVAADDSIELTSTEGQVRIKAKPSTSVDVVPPISVGSGIPVYAGMNGAEPMIRSIKAGANMTVTLEGDTIMLASTGGSGGPVTQKYPYVDGPFFRSDTLWPFSTVVSDLPSATLTASGATLDYTTPQGVDGVAYSAVVVVLGVEQDTPVRVIVSEIHSSGPNWNYIRMASAETQDHGGGDEITIGQPFQGTLSTGTDRVVIYGSYPSDHIDRLLASVEVQVDGVWVGAFTLPGKAPGTGGKVEDSGWITLEAMGGFPYPPEARKINGIVYLRGYCWVDTPYLGEYIARLPEGWRPEKTLYATRSTGTRVRRLVILSDSEDTQGGMMVSVQNGDQNGDYFEFDGISFPQSGRITSGGVGGGGGGEGGSASLENVGGGFPLFQKKVTGPSALRTLLPGPGVHMFRTDTTLRIGLDEMRQVPSTNLFAVDGPDGKLWATWDTAADLLTPDDENAWVDVWVERFERESGYSYGFIGGAEYRGQKSMPVLGFQFALTREAIMRVWVDVLEDGDETGGHFNFAIGSSYDPTQSSQIIAIPAQYDMQWPIEFRLSAYGYEDMLRIEPPAGCQSFNVAIRIEADFTQDGNFVEVAAPLKIESFEGGENDPKVLSNWTEIGTNSSNGWISDSGDYSSPLSPRVRLAFGMVELHGCIRYLGGDSGVGRMAYVDGPFRMHNAREGADIDPYALFPVTVEGPDQNSIAFLRVLPDGGLEISPIPAAGSVVHLTGVRYPLKWPSSLPF